MLEVKYKLKDSNIHGKGVFADEFIPAGKTIWRWTGTEILHEEFLKLNKEEQETIRHSSYRSKNTGNWYLSGDDIEFLNHSDNSNSTEKIDEQSGAGTLIAKVDINPGEEITQDYREFETEEDLEKRGITVKKQKYKPITKRISYRGAVVVVSYKLMSFISKVLGFKSREGIRGISLFSIIIFEDFEHANKKGWLTHELTHFRQELELLIIPFLFLYLGEYSYWRVLKRKSHIESYLLISFEQEAYANEMNDNYMNERKFWAWTKFFNKKSKRPIKTDRFELNISDL